MYLFRYLIPSPTTTLLGKGKQGSSFLPGVPSDTSFCYNQATLLLWASGLLVPCKSKLVRACNMMLPKPCSLQNLSQLQPAIERWMDSLISISNIDCSKMYFVWNEVGNFSSISMHVLFPLYRKRNYFTLVKHCSLVFQWRHGFLLTAWGELTDGNFSWYGEGFWNAIPYELTFGNIPDSVTDLEVLPRTILLCKSFWHWQFLYKHFKT